MQHSAGKDVVEDIFIIIKSWNLIFREIICYLKVLNNEKHVQICTIEIFLL